MRNSRVVLASEQKYNSEKDKLILSLLEQDYILFCVVGVDCEKWEDIIDELAVGDGSNPKFVTTTSHPDESIDEVIEFANMLSLDTKSGVDVIGI
ncbi:DUF7684 family protein [Thalassotalea castellviae]|uniref:DUF7684 domain-containing protein n=1 Tax=Thalassotalea castellviae TaxID=3075612 RepID=A0ABU3A5C9_9GAMM|nr:hypothetical protein [Thalassotalea sp. W431]MDT0605376.1 hypothetical protein [Thalassotalea sp. W431]